MLMLVFKTIFPKVTIQPGGETLLVKMAEAFGLEEDIKFESAEFARNYRVQSPDKKFAYDVCNAQMIEYLLANRGLQIEIQGPVILLAFEPQLPVAQIEFNLQRLIEIRTRLPDYLFTKALTRFPPSSPPLSSCFRSFLSSCNSMRSSACAITSANRGATWTRN